LGNVDGEIIIEYKDFAGLEKTATIMGKGTTAATATEITECGQTIAGDAPNPVFYALSGNIGPCSGNGVNIIQFALLNCQGHSITGSGTGSGIEINIMGFSTVSNCTVSNFNSGIYLNSSNNQAIGNTLTGNYYGIQIGNPATSNIITGNNANNNNFYGIYFSGLSVQLNTANNNNARGNGQTDMRIAGNAIKNTFNGNTVDRMSFGSSGNYANNNTACQSISCDAFMDATGTGNSTSSDTTSCGGLTGTTKSSC